MASSGLCAPWRHGRGFLTSIQFSQFVTVVLLAHALICGAEHPRDVYGGLPARYDAGSIASLGEPDLNTFLTVDPSSDALLYETLGPRRSTESPKGGVQSAVDTPGTETDASDAPPSSEISAASGIRAPRYRRRRKKPRVNYIFVVSPGHQGTASLFKLLQQHLRTDKFKVLFEENLMEIMNHPKAIHILGGARRHYSQTDTGSAHAKTRGTFVHAACSWYQVVAPYAEKASYDFVLTHLIPALDKNRKERQIMVIGHTLNCGRHFEALASILGKKAAFVHINRDRLDTAFGLAECHIGAHPASDGGQSEMALPSVEEGSQVSCYTCTRANFDSRLLNENDWWPLVPNEDSNLQPPGCVYSKFSHFQSRLWSIDEMTTRWHRMKAKYSGPMFIEIYWDGKSFTKDTLSPLAQAVGQHWSFWSSNFTVPRYRSPSAALSEERDLDCLVEQDRLYKAAMGYSPEILHEIEGNSSSSSTPYR